MTEHERPPEIRRIPLYKLNRMPLQTPEAPPEPEPLSRAVRAGRALIKFYYWWMCTPNPREEDHYERKK